MIYEIRSYIVQAGRVPEYEKHFEEALPNRMQYSELAGFWHTELGPLNQVVHIWPYEDLEDREEKRAKAAQGGQWPPKGKELLVSMTSEIFVAAPFSPVLGGGQKLGNIYEMRIYQYRPGTIPSVMERWEEALKGGRLSLSPLAACMYSEIGGLNVWVHLWPYTSMKERARVRKESHELPTWPPKTREFMISQQNKILIPASFSPMA
ncbi:MAG: NIPSNAP family protein [SAR324 cluster bacterium]|nr:NIPSNAP family protein [SAR324 cluster bacterium]